MSAKQSVLNCGKDFELPNALVKQLTEWYNQNARDFAFRKNNTPYNVWVSEIMSQQTRMAQMTDYYERFIEAFPDAAVLAAADLADVLKLWEGLGYYSRAKNLHKTAKILMDEFGGEFPSDYTQLRKLPGFGDYTAGAVASNCFNQAAPAVDGNVLRVTARLAALECDISESSAKKYVRELLLPLYNNTQKRGLLTQSLIELGALVCIPRTPKCNVCPVKAFCKAHALKIAEILPVKSSKKKTRTEKLTVFILKNADTYCVQKRPDKGLLAGLYQFPNTKGHLEICEAHSYINHLGFCNVDFKGVKTDRHIFSHIIWDMRIYKFETACMDNSGFNNAHPFTFSPLSAIPLPTAFKKLVID